MSQGLKVTEFPEVTNNKLDNRDFFLISEFIRDSVYATKKLSAKYITNLKTEAVNLASTDKTDKEIYAGINTGENGQTVLKFRTLKAGTDVNIEQGSESLLINSLIDGSNLTAQADNNATVFFKKESSLLKFKSIVGQQGIVTSSDNNKVYIRPKPHHYFFIPGDPGNPSNNRRIFAQGFSVVPTSTQIKLPTDKNTAYTTGTRNGSLKNIINGSPIIKDAVTLADRGLALVRIYFNTNAGGNYSHLLDVKSIEDKDWTRKISIDPTGGSGAAWEGEDTCTSIIEFSKDDKSFGEFNWKIDVSASTATRIAGWEFTVTFQLEGFFV
jgi:hypothetical protein